MPNDFARFFQRERDTQWVRRSLRTPGILIFGMVLAPCGWILNLTSTVAPNWRTLRNFQDRPADAVIEQGIWDVCLTDTAGTQDRCELPDTTYFNDNQVVEVARGMMLGSLIVTLIGLGVAIPAVRCWKENPLWIVSAIAGILLFCSGVLAIIPISWYNHIIGNVTSQYKVPGLDVRVGYCIILGYIGGIFEVLGGIVMVIGIGRCCGGRNRGHKKEPELPLKSSKGFLRS
uniref:Claudin 23.1 n=1 Tax=Kryptolebias marmoratus TaxID=37003 RepID=A0A3Q3ARB2_KRYMA